MLARLTIPALAGALIVLIAAPAHAQDDKDPPWRFGRLQLTIPPGWSALPTSPDAPQALLIPPKDQRGKALVKVFRPARFPGATLAARLAAAARSINAGRQVARAMPRRLEKTAGGDPVAIQSELTRGEDGKERVTACFGVAAGQAVQVLVLFAQDPETFEALAPAISAMVAGAAVDFPLSKDRPALPDSESVADRCFNLSYRRPKMLVLDDQWGLSARRLAAEIAFDKRRSHTIYARSELQDFIPEDARSFLRSWLLAADFSVESGTEPSIETLAYTDARFADGPRFSALMIKEVHGPDKKVWSTCRVGYLIYGPGWSFLLGAAVGNNKAFRALSAARRARVTDAFFKQINPILLAAVATARWDARPIKRRPELRQRLIDKGAYSYRWTYSYFNAFVDISYFKEDIRSFRFFPDGRCEAKRQRNFGYNSFGSPSLGAPRQLTGIGGRSRPQGLKGSIFRVLSLGDEAALVVEDASGLISLHALAFDQKGTYGPFETAGLAIDGRIEGVYSEGDGYKTYQKAP